MQGKNITFRVRLPAQPREHIYHARRPHRKSRAGCAKCKQRRVKCDETKPRCQRCTKLALDCTYEGILPPGYGNLNLNKNVVPQFTELMSPDATAHSLSLRAVATQIDDLLQIKPGRFSNMNALRHFQDAVTPTVCSKAGQDVMRGKMITLAFEVCPCASPYLMHSIIAVAVAHLRHHQSQDKTIQESKYTFLETHHWHHAITQYTTAVHQTLTTPKTESMESMDPLFSTCLLLTINSFYLPSFNPSLSFVFAPDPASTRTRLTWLLVQSGFATLLSHARPFLRKSIWWEMFMSSRRDEAASGLFDRSSAMRLHELLANLCCITGSSTEENNPYVWPLRMLTPLLDVEPSTETFHRFTTFMGRLSPGFYGRLVRKEVPALMLLAWWLGLMCKLGVWWVGTRATSECTAICMFLEGSTDPLVRRLLEVPARACGYLGRVGVRVWGEENGDGDVDVDADADADADDGM